MRSYFILLSSFGILAACAPPGRDVPLAELALNVTVHVDVGESWTNVYLEPTTPFDTSRCPEIEGTTATFDGVPMTASNLGGGYDSIDPGGGSLIPQCFVPTFTIDMSSITASPDEVTRIRLTDGASTIAIDARGAFTKPAFALEAADATWHRGQTARVVAAPFVVVGPQAIVGTFSPDASPSAWVEIDGNASNGALVFDVPADAPLGPGELDFWVDTQATLDQCTGGSSCLVTMNTNSQQSFRVTIE